MTSTTTRNRRRFANVIALLLPVMFALGLSISAATQPAEGGWVGSGAIEQAQAADTLAAKPRNTWTTKALVEAGWTDCVNVLTDKVTFDNVPTAHVVRLPVSEGWDYVKMSPAEVAGRTAAFGGTTTTADDVKIVANCY